MIPSISVDNLIIKRLSEVMSTNCLAMLFLEISKNTEKKKKKKTGEPEDNSNLHPPG